MRGVICTKTMSYLSIINLKLIGELPDEKEDGDFFERISDELSHAVSSILKEHGLSVISTEMMSHPIQNNNFAQCALCSSWFINRDQELDREDVDNAIKDGVIYDNEPLCCDCLPEGHRWHWSNI